MYLLMAALASKAGTAIKGTTAIVLLGAFSLQMVPPNQNTDVFTKALENGGLLAVVLILLWWIRRDHEKQRQEDKTDLENEKQRNDTLITIIEKNVTAMVGVAASAAAQKDATERVVNALQEVSRHLSEFQMEHAGRERQLDERAKQLDERDRRGKP